MKPTDHPSDCPCTFCWYEGKLAAMIQERKSEVARMRHRIECLRGGLKSASGWFRDHDDTEHAQLCLEMAGDMEDPI